MTIDWPTLFVAILSLIGAATAALKTFTASAARKDNRDANGAEHAAMRGELTEVKTLLGKIIAEKDREIAALTRKIIRLEGKLSTRSQAETQP
ncbi:MAG: hypothetical protein LBG83_06755 [Oscillospiraceae bacterium]|nr:hypothetical protein [Oscillospiraceae bacterium]